MAKLDKSQYTKQQWKQVREQRRAAKNQKRIEKLSEPVSIDENTEKRYVLCLKHGVKYSHDYVNKLYKMVSRNCTLDYEFVCLTDDATGLDSNIKVLPLPPHLTGWWCKPYMYSKELPLRGTILYMDLDVVISGNIDKLFTYQPQAWCTVRDFTRAMRPKWEKYNSSIVRFRYGQLEHVWKEFHKNPQAAIRRFHGDQDLLWDVAKGTATLYPDSWIQSWKWEVRKNKDFKPGGIKGHKQFKTIEHVVPRVECCVCVFHGDPNPHNCEDPWVVDNWR